MRRLLKLTIPSSAAVALRLSHLLVLVALGQLADGETQLGLIAAFGIIAGFGVMADSGAVNYLLSQNAEEISREELSRTLAVHLLVAVGGALLATVYCILALGGALSDVYWLLLAIAGSQVGDSAVRVARAPLLTRGQDVRFGIADAALASWKVAVVAVGIWTESLWTLVALPAGAAVVFAVFARQSYSELRHAQPRPGLAKRVLSYGVAGASSALYSQSPLIVAGALLPLPIVASLSVAYRVAQASEIIAGTLSQQALPRLRSGRLRPAQVWGVLVAVGFLAAVLLVATLPLLEMLLNFSIDPLAVGILVISALPLKFGNYALTAAVYSRGLVGRKLTVSLIVGLLVILLTMIATLTYESVYVALVTILGEIMLAAGLALALRARSEGN